MVVLGETMSSTKFKPVKSLIFLVGPMSHARANPDLAWSADILLGGGRHRGATNVNTPPKKKLQPTTPNALVKSAYVVNCAYNW